MEPYQRHEIRKISTQSDGFSLILHLDNYLTEFSDELGKDPKVRKDLLGTAQRILKERYPDLKVSMVKIIIGGMVVSSISLIDQMNNAQAAELTVKTSQGAQANHIYYQVSSGETLWIISRKFNTSVDHIKRANNLTSDVLQLNQRLIIPKAFHIVKTGDYLTVLAKKYGTTVDGIKKANILASDTTRLGQTLIIPTLIGEMQKTNITPTPVSSQAVSTYTVMSGDSLSVIAKRLGVSTESLRSSNNLKTDIIRVGQELKIPTSGEVTPSASTSTTVSTYMVVSGDSLSVIAKRLGVSTESLRNANNLTTDIIRVGQKLTIPSKNTNTVQPTPDPVVQENRTTFTYSVRTGDSLSVIANRFGVAIAAIQTTNNLKTDTLQVGQVLTIPSGIDAPAQTGANTITYLNHTIASGDNIWDLSVRYGIPQAELLRVNSLTMNSRLSIGQKIKVPVHNIAVKQVVSEKNGEYLDWRTEAQYIFTINKTAKVTDIATGKIFDIKRTIGANHADSETVTVNDTNVAKSIWGGFSWTPRAVILEVDGRKIAASMSFMPHEREYIANNGITGHFDVYFGNSTRHKDGKGDSSHQAQVEKAAGMR
ncbi:LysM peptidoglycan-binding domain-containing protein [Bacillus sp. V3B]|uniref:LysM peptidoglycan-binding domain-containing protein n=1 Tax=Bacillus sp. V3B TaxID=2804915 RepID=UPI00210E60F9|nr:LysM peptidoglycan-binding domain-containing protein [Bacillus sp. V3B]MCQ6276328.1 LysM peptidoglycan-binding domain-containing protein [Bacillus sp. V3B]